VLWEKFAIFDQYFATSNGGIVDDLERFLNSFQLLETTSGKTKTKTKLTVKLTLKLKIKY